MAELSREESNHMRSIGREAAARIARIAENAAKSYGMSRSFATVSKVNSDGTVEVDFGNPSHAMGVGSIRTTTGCAGVKVGDVVVVDTFSYVPLVTGIVSTGANGVVPVSKGGTGATGAATARTNLGFGLKRLYYNYDAGWVVYASDCLVWIYAWGVKTGSGSWDTKTCPYVLPEKYRPRLSHITTPVSTVNGGSWTGVLKVTSAGAISVCNNGNAGSTDARYGVLFYPVGV